MYEENLSLDATLVHAGATGGFDKFMFTARHLGMFPDEAVQRAEWLKRQSPEYVQQVSDRVVELMKGDI